MVLRFEGIRRPVDVVANVVDRLDEWAEIVDCGRDTNCVVAREDGAAISNNYNCSSQAACQDTCARWQYKCSSRC